jgi:hypothetical protein
VVEPTSYVLRISTDMQRPWAVAGSVSIGLRAAEDTPCVVLHAMDMQITRVALSYSQKGSDQEEGMNGEQWWVKA